MYYLEKINAKDSDQEHTDWSHGKISRKKSFTLSLWAIVGLLLLLMDHIIQFKIKFPITRTLQGNDWAFCSNECINLYIVWQPQR